MQNIGHKLINNKSTNKLYINKSVFTDADMLETMPLDTNANLYPMHTFLNRCTASLTIIPMWIGQSYHPWFASLLSGI